jgi:hypothetical protein
VSAAPQLRDLKKEATAFIPTSVKRKKPGTSTGSLSKVNAAPSLGPDVKLEDAGSESTATSVRPDLLGILKNQFGPVPNTEGGLTNSKGGTRGAVVAKSKDDYDKFVEEMGDILGSTS